MLEAAGFRIVARQARVAWVPLVDGEPFATELRADYLVEARGELLVAEVKTGRQAPSLATAATRRQLLEYRVAFDADGVLLVCPEASNVSTASSFRATRCVPFLHLFGARDHNRTMTSDVELVGAQPPARSGRVRRAGRASPAARVRRRARALSRSRARRGSRAGAFVAAWRDLDRRATALASARGSQGSHEILRRARCARGTPRALAVEPPADAPTPEDHAVEREDRELLQRALGELPEAHREALVLYYLQGESVAQIAGVLGITEDLVKQRLSRARRALRESVAARVESVLSRARPRPGIWRDGRGQPLDGKRAQGRGRESDRRDDCQKLAVAVLVLAVAGGAALWYGKRAKPGSTARCPRRRRRAVSWAG